jgi:hypothetical protein
MPDWLKVEEPLLNEIIRQAEARLGAQLTAAVGADQRAYNFTAAMISVTLALGSGAGVAFTNAAPILGFAACIAAVVCFLAAGMAYWAGRPQAHYFVGCMPNGWFADIDTGKKYQAALGEVAEHYDEMLQTNDSNMAKAGRQLKNAAILAFTAPLLAGLAFVVANSLTSSVASAPAASMPAASMPAAPVASCHL